MEDGVKKYFWDYIDIFNFHYYTTNPANLIGVANKIHDAMLAANVNKETWLTEFGYTTYYVSEYLKSTDLPKQMLIALALGINKIFAYQFRCSDLITDDSNNTEGYFGLIHRSTNVSSISILDSESRDKALSDGDGLLNVKSTDGIFRLNIDSSIKYKIKTNGMYLKLHDCDLSNITINGEIVYQESNAGVKEIALEAALFSLIENGDHVEIHTLNYSTDDTWKGLETTPAYYSVKYLNSLLQNGATRPILYKDSEVYKIKWNDARGNHIEAVWSDESTSEITTNKIVMDYLGNIINAVNITINNEIKYFIN